MLKQQQQQQQLYEPGLVVVEGRLQFAGRLLLSNDLPVRTIGLSRWGDACLVGRILSFGGKVVGVATERLRP